MMIVDGTLARFFTNDRKSVTAMTNKSVLSIILTYVKRMMF